MPTTTPQPRKRKPSTAKKTSPAVATHLPHQPIPEAAYSPKRMSRTTSIGLLTVLLVANLVLLIYNAKYAVEFHCPQPPAPPVVVPTVEPVPTTPCKAVAPAKKTVTKKPIAPVAEPKVKLTFD